MHEESDEVDSRRQGPSQRARSSVAPTDPDHGTDRLASTRRDYSCLPRATRAPWPPPPRPTRQRSFAAAIDLWTENNGQLQESHGDTLGLETRPSRCPRMGGGRRFRLQVCTRPLPPSFAPVRLTPPACVRSACGTKPGFKCAAFPSTSRFSVLVANGSLTRHF